MISKKRIVTKKVEETPIPSGPLEQPKIVQPVAEAKETYSPPKSAYVSLRCVECGEPVAEGQTSVCKRHQRNY